MSRRMKKADGDMPVDLISNLPRNVIDHILEMLPIQDAVRTSILSRKWRYMWHTVPRLVFDENFFKTILIGGHRQDHEIPSVIMEILLLHDGPLQEFVICIPDDYPTRVIYLGQWILYLSRSGIKEIGLINYQPDPYEIPSHLFSCKHLVKLELSHFAMTPPPDFGGFKCLIELHLFDVRIDSDMLESLISGCPLLENLTISYCFGFECLNISAPSLHYLLIEDDRAFKSIGLKKLKNLVVLTLQVYIEDLEGGRRSNLVDFSSLPKLEKLRLGNGYIKFLSTGSIPETLSNMIYSLKHLQLDEISFTEVGHMSLLACLLKSCHNLVEFEVKIRNRKSQPILSCFGESVCNGCSLGQLRTVNIRVNSIFEPAVDLAKYVLANSPLLKILTFKIDGKPSDVGKVLRVTRDLLQIRRASTKAEVKFLCDGFF